MVRAGSDNAYGIYLSHLLFLIALAWAGWGRLSSVIPWPALCLATVVIVLAAAMTLTAVLARTPLAVPLTGRARVPWRLAGTAQRARTGVPVRAASLRAASRVMRASSPARTRAVFSWMPESSRARSSRASSRISVVLICI